jgi:uncharacterized protein YecT (DUF1311 family)
VIARALVISAGLLALCACDPSQTSHVSSPADPPLIQTTGFEAPIDISIVLNDVVSPQGALIDAPNSHVVAQFVRMGRVAAAPLGSSPWVTLSVDGASSPSASLTFAVAHRAIDGRTGEHTYMLGNTTYFAETIGYSIVPDAGYERFVRPVHALSFRLVAMLDPASNAWVVDKSPTSGTTFNANDTLGIVGQFTLAPLDPLTDAIHAAQQRALDAVEQQMANSGLLRRGTASGVVESPRSGLAFALIQHFFQQSTQAQAMQECASFAANGYSRWHLATQAEFMNLVSGNTIIDTPDGRFWRGGASVANSGWNDIVLAPDPSLPGNVPEWETNNVGTGQINGWMVGQVGVVPRPFLAICATGEHTGTSAAPSLPSSPPVPANTAATPSFDCAKAPNWAARMICGDATLAALDRGMATLYFAKIRSLAGAEREALRAEQRRWISERETCSSASNPSGCLQASFTTRTRALAAIR